MVYPKSWKLEGRFGTGKTLKSVDWIWILTSGYEALHLNIVCREDCHDWSYVRFTFVSELKNLFWVWSLRHWVRVRCLSFGMMSHHLSFVLEERRIILWLFFWIPDVSWNWNHGYFSSFRIWTFLSILDWTSVQCSEMECHVERGCESWSPYGWPVRVTYSWRHVILHRKRHGEGRSFWYSFVHGRLIVDNIQYVVGKVCAFDLQFDHDTLLSE
jgi:hypothetical protein